MAAVLLFGMSVSPAQEETTLNWYDEAQWQAALKGEADVNARDKYGYTALHLAASPEEARRFIELGADINAVTDWGCSVLRYLCIFGEVDVARVVLEKGPTADDVKASLRAGCIYGRVEIVRLLLQYGADINTVDDETNTLLHYACGHVECEGEMISGSEQERRQLVTMLLEAGLSPNARNKEGNTPLHLAARGQTYAVIPLLLAAGADHQAKNEEGRTPVSLLRLHPVRGRDFYEAEGFLSHGSDVALLHHFLEKDDVPAVRLMKNRGADLSSVVDDEFRKTPLHWSQSVEMTQQLLEAGADVGARDKWDRTPLFYARTPEMVKLLVQHGADVNATAQYHETALNLSMFGSLSANVTEALLEAGAELNPENAMPPLHAACIYGNLPMVEKLLRMGANPHLKSHAGKTAPDYARQRPEIVRLLENIQK